MFCISFFLSLRSKLQTTLSSRLLVILTFLPHCTGCSLVPIYMAQDNTWNIRIYHECEGRIEKFGPMIAIWHHEACPVMTNGDSLGRIFLSYPHTNNGFFFLLTTVFYFKISFQKSLNTLRYNCT